MVQAEGASLNVLFLDDSFLYDDLLPAGLRQVGCAVRRAPEVLNGALDRVLAEFRPDFALMMGWSAFPTNERLAVIREAVDRHRIPLIFWTTEDPVWHEQWSLHVVNTLRPDLVATICAECVPRYEALGYRAACLPFGYNHHLYRPVPPRPEYACDIAVVANFYTADYDQLNRKRSLQELVVPLLGRGYNIKIWGLNWDLAPQYGIPLPPGVWQHYLGHRDAPAVYNSAKIILGVQNEYDYATNLTMRTCEVMGSGGFLLASRTRATTALFQHRRHLALSGSPGSTVALVDYYLSHPEERAQVAAAGRQLVRAHFTYAHRARQLLRLFRRLVRPRGAALAARG